MKYNVLSYSYIILKYKPKNGDVGKQKARNNVWVNDHFRDNHKITTAMC